MSLYTDIDLLTTEELLRLPPQSWLMEGILPLEGFCCLYGAPSSGKSFVALDWSCCISEGLAWCGRKTEQAPVVYIAAEGGRGIRSRIQAWMIHHGYTDLPALYFMLNALPVRESGAVEAFLEELERREVWPGLLVLDTLSRSFGGGDENAPSDMGLFVERVTELARGRRMAALVIHHENAAGTRERGHTSFWGALDTMFRAKAHRHKQTEAWEYLELVNKKQKDEAELPPIFLKPHEVGGSLVFTEVDAPPLTVREGGQRPPMNPSDMLTLMRSHGEYGLTMVELLHMTGLSRSTFFKRVANLKKSGLAYQADGRYFAVPSTKDLAGVEENDE